ncbi:unnamed protein product [Closterium sp. Yama58-4]|nr:unnamed protein product [Closterium sp. Yama58-4]
MGCAASHARGSETPPPPRLGSSRSDARSPYPVRKSAEAGGGVCEYSYQEVHAATGGFQHELGSGGFGVVYHGYLAEPHGVPAGGKGAAVWAVAVKLMSGEHIANGIDSFMTEVAVMARVHHPNILRLEGYVVGATPILIYDYIPNGDAASYLAKARSGEVQFSWRDRLRVALGCAEALTAIHANNFVHRDFKAPNVLLREDLTPVVADFGLARAVDDWKTHVETRVMGSVGYIDPIYFESGNLSKKSDTYAFGIFFLELISGTSALDSNFKELRRLVNGNDYPDAALVMDPHLAGQWQLKHVLVAFTLIKFAIFYDWETRPGMDTPAARASGGRSSSSPAAAPSSREVSRAALYAVILSRTLCSPLPVNSFLYVVSPSDVVLSPYILLVCVRCPARCRFPQAAAREVHAAAAAVQRLVDALPVCVLRHRAGASRTAQPRMGPRARLCGQRAQVPGVLSAPPDGDARRPVVASPPLPLYAAVSHQSARALSCMLAHKVPPRPPGDPGGTSSGGCGSSGPSGTCGGPGISGISGTTSGGVGTSGISGIRSGGLGISGISGIMSGGVGEGTSGGGKGGRFGGGVGVGAPGGGMGTASGGGEGGGTSGGVSGGTFGIGMGGALGTISGLAGCPPPRPGTSGGKSGPPRTWRPAMRRAHSGTDGSREYCNGGDCKRGASSAHARLPCADTTCTHALRPGEKLRAIEAIDGGCKSAIHSSVIFTLKRHFDYGGACRQFPSSRRTQFGLTFAVLPPCSFRARPLSPFPAQAAKIPVELQLAADEAAWLAQMAATHGLPDAGKALRIVLTYARDENLGALGGKEAIQSPSSSLATHSFEIESFHEGVLRKIQEANNCDSVSEAVRVLLHHVQAAVSEAILFGLVRCKRPLNCTSCPAHAAAAAAKAAPPAAPAAAE